MKQQDIFNDKEDKSLLAAFGWWEKRRLAYNLVVGACGVLVLIFLRLPLDPSLVIDVVLYGVIVNLFYTLGFLIEVISRYYFKSGRNFSQSRNGLFWTGLVISVLVTLGIGLMLDSIPQHD